MRSYAAALLAPLLLMGACARRDPPAMASTPAPPGIRDCSVIPHGAVPDADSGGEPAMPGDVAGGVRGSTAAPRPSAAGASAMIDRENLPPPGGGRNTARTDRCGEALPTAALVAAALGAPPPAPLGRGGAAERPPAPTTTPVTRPSPAPTSPPAAAPASSPTGAGGAAVAALRTAPRQNLQQHVDAARAACQRQRRPDCEAVAENAAIEFENAWQARSAGAARPPPGGPP